MAGNRTRVNCLEGSYAHHYTTDACTWCKPMEDRVDNIDLDQRWRRGVKEVKEGGNKLKRDEEKKKKKGSLL